MAVYLVYIFWWYTTSHSRIFLEATIIAFKKMFVPVLTGFSVGSWALIDLIVVISYLVSSCIS